jgi:enoyl-CoA hydratase/carnithine racemase
MPKFHSLTLTRGCAVLRLASADRTNRLSRACLAELMDAVETLRTEAEQSAIRALIITGNSEFFSAGADLNEIARLTGPSAYEFGKKGQKLMQSVDAFPVPVIAAVRGYCLGGALDLALACDFRLAAPNAIFGHRGATLGLMTGWGGTQRLPRLIGKARALEMFITAARVSAAQALSMRLVDAVVEDPVQEALRIAPLATVV